MDPITEVAFYNLKSPEVSQQVSQTLRDIVLQQPGCLRVRWGVTKEDATQARSFVDWEDISRHEQFSASPSHAELREKLTPFVEPPVEHHHIKFRPTPSPVLDNEGPNSKTPLVEMLYLHFPFDDSFTPELKDQATSNVERFLADTTPDAMAMGCTGETAFGWSVDQVDFKGEPSRAMVVLGGWESLEAHGKFRGSESFGKNVAALRGTQGLKGVSVVHSSFATAERRN